MHPLSAPTLWRSKRVIGPDPLIRRIFDLVEAGHTFRVRGEGS